MTLFASPLKLVRPGLFITATDTDVGKTVVTCAIAAALRQQTPGTKVAVCKPMATGCRRDREGLIAQDAEALAHFSDCRQPLDVICPVRYVPPAAPAVAAEMTGTAVDFDAIARSLQVLDEWGDCMLVEGVGGILVPIDHRDPQVTVLDLAVALGYPVVVVARAGLGTLNHTAMTTRILKSAGCRVAGIVINGYDADSSRSGDRSADISMTSNRQWLAKMTRLPILATVPRCTEPVAPHQGQLPAAILDAVALTWWSDVADVPLVKP